MFGIQRSRPPASMPGAAAALAARLEVLCAAGIELRARGACAAPDRRETGHALRGHDAGCRTVGMPLERTLRVLRRWDLVGAAGVLAEALREAVEEIDALGEEWSPARAREIVGYAIAQRITPRPQTRIGPRLPAESRPEGSSGSALRSRGSRRNRRPRGADAPDRGSEPRRRRR